MSKGSPTPDRAARRRVGAQIEQAGRERFGKSWAGDIADATGVLRQEVWRWKRGEIGVPEEKLRTIAALTKSPLSRFTPDGSDDVPELFAAATVPVPLSAAVERRLAGIEAVSDQMADRLARVADLVDQLAQDEEAAGRLLGQLVGRLTGLEQRIDALEQAQA